MTTDNSSGQDQPSQSQVLITVEELYTHFKHILDKEGFTADKSDLCARIFANNSRDGVLSHGINRFPDFIDFIHRGLVDIHADPTLDGSFGAFERWDGQQGPGVLNAHFCMQRAIALAGSHGIGCTALKNTNHWMRGGNYGLQAADANCIGICWTNTTVLMPPWGSMEAKLGNNPLIICVPRKEGHLLFDAAMSQFSIGRLLITAKTNEKLPVPGGFDDKGNLTDDAEAILDSKNPLPIGFWKGSGLSLLLDCVVSVLSSGQATNEIGASADETNVSQIFIAIDLKRTDSSNFGEDLVDRIIDDLHKAQPISESNPVTFPGERMLQKRIENNKNGIRVDADIWEKVLAL